MTDLSEKGKTITYTSANGHMFSLLNKAGEIGIRFSKEDQRKYMQELDTTVFKSHILLVFLQNKQRFNMY